METVADMIARVLYVITVWVAWPYVAAVIVGGWIVVSSIYGLRRVLRLGGG